MEFRFSADEERFRQDIRDFLKSEVTEDILKEAESGLGYGPNSWQFLRKLGAKGWLTPSWPREYGGLGLSPVYRFIVDDELSYSDALPLPGKPIATSIVGPTIMLYGSPEQKNEYLPRIARGEIEFAQGYTEPGAGSDLAALQMRAVKDGVDYIVSGQKVYNTRCHYAQYHWLAVRTDPMAPKHRGISLLIVDLKSPGITIRPLWTMGALKTNEAFYDEVRVPRKNLVGEENQGFHYITTALNLERGFAVGDLRRTLDELVAYVKTTKRDGKLLVEDPLVRQKVAEMAVEVEVAYMLAYQVLSMQCKRSVLTYETSSLKLFATELRQRLNNSFLQILGPLGLLQKGSRWAKLDGRMELRYRDDVVLTIGGGSSEIQRNTIAVRGLGLPR